MRLSPFTPANDFVDSDKQRVQDAVLEKQKDRPVGQVFAPQSNWKELLDAVADVYIGV